MDRYFLLDQGFPYAAVLREDEAAALYAAAAPDQRSGSVEKGAFTTWIVLENGVGRRVPWVTRARLILPDELPAVVRQVGRLGPVPAELAQAA